MLAEKSCEPIRARFRIKNNDVVCSFSPTNMDAALSSVLSDLENISSLKEEQTVALKAFLSKKDVFAVLPTGFGKSVAAPVFYVAISAALIGWILTNRSKNPITGKSNPIASESEPCP